MADPELLPCPFCGVSLTKPTPVQYPTMGLARLHPGDPGDVNCPIAGWGFYDHQLAAWNTRTALSNTSDTVRVRKTSQRFLDAFDAAQDDGGYRLWHEVSLAAEELRAALSASTIPDVGENRGQ